MRRLILILLVVTSALFACGDDDDAKSSSTTEPAEEAAGGVTIEDGASCSNVEDGGTSAELESVELDTDGGDLVATWTVGGPPDADDEVLYTITGFDLDGNNGARLGASTDPDGESTGSFILVIGDEDDEKSEDLGDTDGLVDDVIEARFPLDQIEGWDEGFRWFGAVAVDGERVDGCPSVNGATKIDSLTGDTFTVG